MPNDAFNRTLNENVFPHNWKNPNPAPLYDLVIIGAGPGGMTAAMIALQAKARIAIVEKAHFGGECLNVGCIPSKALLRSSRLAAEIRDAEKWGIRVPSGWWVDFEAVMRRVRKLRSEISVFDRVENFTKLGADVFLGVGRFSDRNEIDVGGKVLHFKKAIIATGTQPALLDIPGLLETEYLTNQSIFNLTKLPKRLAVIGVGPISCELSQAFLRFGSEVTQITRGAHLLPKEDMAASQILQKILEKEGMQFIFNAHIQSCEKKGKEKILHFDLGKKKNQKIIVDDVLLAIGRRPAIGDLGLERAGVHFDAHTGIVTNETLHTSNPDIFAIDAMGRYNFTHISIELAKIAIHNALLGKNEMRSSLVIPWCTYTDPEIAHIGLSEKEIQEKGISAQSFTVDLATNDRAILDSETLGFITIWVKEGTDQILGATLMARHAGDMISEISVAMASHKGLSAIMQGIHPFPTQGQILQSVAEMGLKALSKPGKPSKKAA